MSGLIFALVGLLLVGGSDAKEKFLVVPTGNGPIRGELRGAYYAFEGIPFAKAPVGDLRLAAPVLNDAHWKEPLDALKPGPACIQWSHLIKNESNRLMGEEDCLYLNIYVSTISHKDPLPTVVHIHGGAFMFGSGHFWRPDHLLTRPMIFVTFNYRLGPMGFLSTEDDVIPGNFGMKDQVVALQWINRNIVKFGGSPHSITLSGFSAGSASVQLLYLSKLSRGLFKNGIAHSGSALNPWALAENSANKTWLIASSIGCSTRSSEEMLKCLRQKPAEEIVAAVRPLFDYLYNPFSPLGIVFEKQTKNNPTPFLTQHPLDLLKKGDFYKVPILLALDEAEGLYPGGELVSKPEYIETIDQKWDRLLPSILDFRTSLRDSEAKQNEISHLIRKRYLGERKLTKESFQDFVNLLSNRLYIAGVIRSARLMQVHTPVYLYYNFYKIVYGIGEDMANGPQNFGASHGEDIVLLFNSEIRQDVPYNREELTMAGRFVEMYDNFARHNVARFADHEIPRMTKKNVLQYLEINYPNCVQRESEQLSDENFWYKLDFKDGLTDDYESPAKTEL
ncbi:venom carboxylesterase-6-like [Uranotaenia lowii]|uniref:venom carboxylesterase-6-like n=1 Tax=Uranotaenia lowii TaxID=190385 RepID=UPI00247A9219|nr:venom carboxylesterase-6-like [Uranotaenia lowii]